MVDVHATESGALVERHLTEQQEVDAAVASIVTQQDPTSGIEILPIPSEPDSTTDDEAAATQRPVTKWTEESIPLGDPTIRKLTHPPPVFAPAARTPVTVTTTSATTAEMSKATRAAVTIDLTPLSSATVTTISTATRTAVAVARVRALQTHVRQSWPDRHVRPAARDIAAYRITSQSDNTPTEIARAAAEHYHWRSQPTINTEVYVRGALTLYDIGRRTLIDQLNRRAATPAHTTAERATLWLQHLEWMATLNRPATPDDDPFEA